MGWCPRRRCSGERGVHQSASNRHQNQGDSVRMSLMSTRRRVMKSMAIKPIACPSGSPCNGSAPRSVVLIHNVVKEVACSRPGGPSSGEIHSRPVRSRAVKAATVVSERNAAMPERNSPRDTIGARRATCARIRGVLLNRQLAAMESHSGAAAFVCHRSALSAGHSETTGQSLSTRANTLK